MDLKFFDAHCHVQPSQFDIDRAEVLERMEEGRFGGVVIGVDFATSREALELAEQYGFLWAAVGLHPHDNVAEEFDMVSYRELAIDPKVVAIGECGLDYFRSGETKEERDAQKHRFEGQIKQRLRSANRSSSTAAMRTMTCSPYLKSALEVSRGAQSNHPFFYRHCRTCTAISRLGLLPFVPRANNIHRHVRREH